MMIIQDKPKSIPAESYRELRTNIKYSILDKEKRAILVTSSEPGEGKSITAANLALSLAEDNKMVILLDCDLRKPSLHKNFRVSNEAGISDVLAGEKKLDDALKEIGVGFHLLTSGKTPPNPSKVLDSNKMTEFIEMLKENYDYIIMDTPPVLLVSDAKILSTKVDGVILVVKAQKTKRENIINAKRELEKVNANIIGTILNGTEEKKEKYYYYYGDGENNEDKQVEKRKFLKDNKDKKSLKKAIKKEKLEKKKKKQQGEKEIKLKDNVKSEKFKNRLNNNKELDNEIQEKDIDVDVEVGTTII